MKKSLVLIRFLLLICFADHCAAQIGYIKTVSGNGTNGYTGDGGPATAAEIGGLLSLANDANGNIYFGDNASSRIRKVDASGFISTFAGGGLGGDGGPATAAHLSAPGGGIATDRIGNVYFSDGSQYIRKVNTAGIISTIAGNGSGTFSGDGGPATAAGIEIGYGLVVDAIGNIYFSSQYRIRRIDTSGIISTIAGNGTNIYSGDGGPATAAGLGVGSTGWLAMDVVGNIYVSEPANNVVRVINSSGTINRFAGNLSMGYSGDGGPATLAMLHDPSGLATDSTGNLFIAEGTDFRIRMVNSAGIISTIAGTGLSGSSGDGGPATAAHLSPNGLSTDLSGNLYLTDYCRVRKILLHNSAPVFTGGHSQSITVCGNSPADSINALMAVYDSDYSEQESWSIVSPPVHGSVIVTDTLMSARDTLHPHGMYYTPTAFYYGADSFKVRVTDGIASDTTTIHITINSAPAAIAGTAHTCTGATSTLTDITGGSVWSSSNTSVATIGTSSGIVTGVSAGVVTISYTLLSDGCPTVTTFTVNPLPPAVTGSTHVCAGATTTLADSATGGTWTTTATAAAVGSATGTVSGIAAGTATITYTLPTGCQTTTVMTVNPVPAVPAVTGGVPAALCIGATISLTDATGTGSWSSGSAAIAGIGSGTGVVTGVSSGAAAMSYTIADGCSSALVVTVSTVPAAISGGSAACPGSSVSLSDATAGGAWSSSNPAIAAVGSGTGVVTGVTSGAATITYSTTSGAGCYSVYGFTVNAGPLPLTGPPAVCAFFTATYSDPVSGGTWTSSAPATADIDAVSGLVTGLASGTATLTYTIPSTGCYVTRLVSINPAPSGISGAGSVCAGSSLPLYDGVSGGIWSSATPAVGTVDASSGLCTGIGPGTAVISYSTGTGCSVSATVTVDALPGTITGGLQLCAGGTTALADSVAGGVWSAGSGYAIVGSSSGVVTGITAGTVVISYTTGGGCPALATVTVNPLPGPITGTWQVCPGAQTALSCSGSGTWSSSNLAIATVGSSGLVTGVSPGNATITFTTTAGCATTAAITVNTLPAAIGGPVSVCTGQTVTLTDATPGGTWSKSNTNVSAGSTTGVVAGFAAGTSVISYTVLSTGCTATRTETVNAVPSAITGSGMVCAGAMLALGDVTPGGTWTSSNAGVAVVGSTGTVQGVSAGSATISYAEGTGCYATKGITVNALPALYSVTGGGSYCAGGTGLHVGLSGSVTGTVYRLYTNGIGGISLSGSGGTINFGLQTIAGTYTVAGTTGAGCSGMMSGSAVLAVNALPSPVAGPLALCVGTTATVTDSGGGTWSSAVPAIATIGSVSGQLTGIGLGTTMITYTLPTTCASTAMVTVSAGPSAISGPASICAGAAATLTDSISGGVWTSSHPATALIGSLSGGVTGISPGTVTITYSLGGGCTVTRSLTVTASPASITGTASVCTGSSTGLSDVTPGGVWSSSNTAAAPVSVTGVVTGMSADTATIYYTLPGCAAARQVTVTGAPAAIGGSGSVCVGSATTETDGVSGGTWSTTSAAISVGTGTGVVTGISTGTAQITYTTGGCEATRTMTVNPVASISGPAGLCTGTTGTLTASVAGGSWLSSNTSVATAGSTGIVSGISTGTSVITYTTPSGCISHTTVTVNTGPAAIGGTLHVCMGATTALTNVAAGGTWISSNTSVAGVGSSSGVVTGVSAGTSVITYSLGSGCEVTAVVTVNASPSAITGPGGGQVCVGSALALTDATTGGTWSSGDAATAVVSGTGVVSGISAGTAPITYSSGGCTTATTITVNPLPGSITGAGTLCSGLTANWSDSTVGGLWSSAAPATATVGTAGMVSGLLPGVAAISYTLPTGCAATKAITINAAPAAITGMLTVCVGSATALSDISGGGSWSTGAGSTATVGSSGVVTGVSTGTAAISYAAGGCPAVAVVTVSALPAAISGPDHVCYTNTVTLTDSTAGGLWSSSNPVVAAIGTGGAVTGLSVGVTNISYSMGAGCTVSRPVTVSALPSAVTAPATVCPGGTVSLSDTSSGGLWSSSNTATGTISVTGVVTGLSAGSSTISYYVPSIGCAATHVITVEWVPPVTGVHSLCAWGDTMTVADSATTGLYTSSLALVSNPGGGIGAVTSTAPGTAHITYILPSGCTTTASFTVNVLPGLIAGAGDICVGGTETVTDGSPGGTWSATGGAVTIGSATGTVTGISGGGAHLTYTLNSTGCRADTAITVITAPAAGTISGPGSICAGGTIILTDSISGGTWSSTGGIASVAGGTVSTVSAGVDTIGYTVTNMCGGSTAQSVITINALPAAGVITGSDTVCAGTVVMLSATMPGGVWSLSNALATIDSTGRLQGIAPGADTVTYTVSNGWCTASAGYVEQIAGGGGCLALGAPAAAAPGIGVWPNPATGELHIGHAGPFSYIIYNIMGEAVLRGQVSTTGTATISIVGLIPDTYQLHLTTDQGAVRNVRVVKE